MRPLQSLPEQPGCSNKVRRRVEVKQLDAQGMSNLILTQQFKPCHYGDMWSKRGAPFIGVSEGEHFMYVTAPEQPHQPCQISIYVSVGECFENIGRTTFGQLSADAQKYISGLLVTQPLQEAVVVNKQAMHAAASTVT